MNNITEITKRDIFDLFQKGYIESCGFLDDQHVSYPYHGRLSEIDFLKKLYYMLWIKCQALTKDLRMHRKISGNIQSIMMIGTQTGYSVMIDLNY